MDNHNEIEFAERFLQVFERIAIALESLAHINTDDEHDEQIQQLKTFFKSEPINKTKKEKEPP